ncbi:MAG: thymidine kinase [Alphaproteobacteria bacterium]|nr:thymidine kinase [Alphaproteobacteria bacterium]
MAKLYFYYSAMNAGKTTKLLQNNFNYIERGMKTVLYTFVGDNRYGTAKITSRIGLSSDANVFDSNTKLFDEISKLSNSSNEKIACILIDEAQFLNKKQVKDLCRIVDELNIPVLTYGLRTDFLGEPFEGSLYLLLWGDELVEVKTICHCGSKATMNAKFDSNGEMITVNNKETNSTHNNVSTNNLTNNTIKTKVNHNNQDNDICNGVNIKKNNNIRNKIQYNDISSSTHNNTYNISNNIYNKANNELDNNEQNNSINKDANNGKQVNNINTETSINSKESINMNQVDIGGNEKYIALCRKHYFMGKLK